MFLRLVHRVLSISLAAVLTLGMFGSIDSLSQPASADANWVQRADSRPQA